MFDDFDFAKEWADCLDYAKLAEVNKPLTTQQERELLAEYFYLKQVLDENLEPEYSTIDSKRRQQIKDKLILCNLRLIIKNCKHPRFTGKGIPLKELIQEGILGLIYFLDNKYDINLGNKLMTGGVNWILQAAGRSIENKSRVVKLPLHIQAKINKVRTVCRELSGEDIKPSAEELSVRIEDKYGEYISPEEVAELGRFQYLHSSLDESTEEGQSSLLDFISTNGHEEIEEDAERSANKDYVKELLSKLTKEEAKLITWKYGLIDLNTRRSSKELAAIMGMSIEDYKPFESHTMSKLRQLGERERVNL